MNGVRARNQALRSLTVVVVCALMGVLLADQGVAWLDRHEGQSETGLLVPDGRLGWVNRPDFVGEQVRTDGLGLRNPPIPDSAPSEELRILVLGDSRIHGSGVEDRDVFSVALERLLTERGLSVRVLNGGTNSYTALQSARRGLVLLPVVKPDLVLLFLSPGWTLRPNAHVGNWVSVGSRLVPGDVLESWPALLHPAVAAAHDALKASALYQRHRSVAMKGGEVSEHVRHFVLSRAEPPALVKPFLDATSVALTELHREAQALGAEVRVVLLPETFQINPDIWNRYLVEHADAGTPEPGISRFEPMQALSEYVEATGLATWMFYAEIQAFMSDVDRYYQADEAHWNAAGHEAMGRALVDALDREALAATLLARRQAAPR